jgi:predicted RNA-binding Zn-ribbon protein involved in translation (DUF1610 family)
MDPLDRLFHRLVNNIRNRNPAHLTLPFTVAELYEQIVPYRHNRRELGIETNQDYELTVMRLLSGERGYLLGDESMQESLRRELETHDPDAGAFREFATAEVSISPNSVQGVARTPSDAAASAQRSSGQRESPAESGHTRPAAAASGEAATAPTAATAAQAGASRIPVTGVSPDAGCRFCGATLPEGKQVKFCPNCGQNLSINRCPACGSEIESGWKFCITCGRAAGA